LVAGTGVGGGGGGGGRGEVKKTLHSSEREFVCDDTLTTVLLATARVTAVDKVGNHVVLRALFDSASQSTLITEDACQRLCLKRKKGKLTISGLGNEDNVRTSAQVQFKLVSNEGEYIIDAYVLKAISGNLPSAKIDLSGVKGLSTFKLADQYFHQPAGVDLLLGADVYHDLIMDARIRDGSVFLQQTVFGWTVTGKAKFSRETAGIAKTSKVSFVSTSRSNFDMAAFWATEDVPSLQVAKLKPEEALCVEHYDKTTRIDPETGKFIVSLPFTPDATPLGYSRHSAERRLRSMERKLSITEDTYELYRKFMSELIDSGHLVLVPESEISSAPSTHFFMPHHYVEKDSTTTKLRVVFDASAKTSSAVALNENLLIGPKLQDDLFDILTRFRFFEIGLTGDITKMYRSVGLDKPDQDYHRVLWRDNESQEMRTYKMTRVTYGVTSSSYHAIRSLRESAAKKLRCGHQVCSSTRLLR
jgi:hypothetical protein